MTPPTSSQPLIENGPEEEQKNASKEEHRLLEVISQPVEVIYIEEKVFQDETEDESDSSPSPSPSSSSSGDQSDYKDVQNISNAQLEERSKSLTDEKNKEKEEEQKKEPEGGGQGEEEVKKENEFNQKEII